MLSEAPLRKIFELLKGKERDSFTSHDIYSAVCDISGMHRSYSPSDIFLRTRLCASTIDQVVEIQTQRLIERKAIEILDVPSVDRQYKILA